MPDTYDYERAERLWDVFLGSTWVGRLEREDGEDAMNAMHRLYPASTTDQPERWRLVRCFPNRIDHTLVPPTFNGEDNHA